jgi:hypothetical protein
MTEVAVLIAERGARWSDWARAWCGPARELVLLIQHGQEAASEFRARIEQGLERMQKRTSTVQQVVLIAGDDNDASTLVARAQLVRAILAKLGKGPRAAQLVLDAGSEQATALRRRRSLGGALADARHTAAGRAALASGKLMVPLSAAVPHELTLDDALMPPANDRIHRSVHHGLAHGLVRTREHVARETARSLREGTHEALLAMSTEGARRLH